MIQRIQCCSHYVPHLRFHEGRIRLLRYNLVILKRLKLFQNIEERQVVYADMSMRGRNRGLHIGHTIGRSGKELLCHELLRH